MWNAKEYELKVREVQALDNIGNQLFLLVRLKEKELVSGD